MFWSASYFDSYLCTGCNGCVSNLTSNILIQISTRIIWRTPTVSTEGFCFIEPTNQRPVSFSCWRWGESFRFMHPHGMQLVFAGYMADKQDFDSYTHIGCNVPTKADGNISIHTPSWGATDRSLLFVVDILPYHYGKYIPPVWAWNWNTGSAS